jgi:aryl-alcohol dehydrogenase-like predicted oxidoreductase
MKKRNILGAAVIIAVALGGAYGIANWQAGDTQTDVHEVMVKIEAWDNVLSNIVSEFEQELILMETKVEGMGMSEKAVDKRKELTRKFREQTISSSEVNELRRILEEEKARAEKYNNSLAILATRAMLSLLSFA